MRRRSGILAIASLAVVNALGCGGSEHARVDPEQMLESAAAHTIETAEVDAELRLRAEGAPQLDGPIRVRVVGPYSREDGGVPSLDWGVSASALGFPVGGRLTSTGENVYLSVYGSGYEVGEEGVAAANARLAEAGGVQADLRGWLGPARVTGEESAGGVACERIAAPLRGKQVERDLVPLAAALGTAVPAVSGRATVCIGFDDRTLHDIELDARLRPAPGQPALPGGATEIRIGADVELSEVGQPQPVSAPGGAHRPIRDLLLTLNDFGVPIPLG